MVPRKIAPVQPKLASMSWSTTSSKPVPRGEHSIESSERKGGVDDIRLVGWLRGDYLTVTYPYLSSGLWDRLGPCEDHPQEGSCDRNYRNPGVLLLIRNRYHSVAGG